VDAPAWIEVVELQRHLTAGETVVPVDVRQPEKFSARPGQQRLRWAAFEERLSSIRLRAYLKKLPDFEDVEAEGRAMRHALGFRSFPAALDFLRGWPDQARAAQLMLTRAAEIDGNLYYLLDPAAQLIEGKHPLAATLLRRAIIEDTLDGAHPPLFPAAARFVGDSPLEGDGFELPVPGHGELCRRAIPRSFPDSPVRKQDASPLQNACPG
jgi:hypothetical protein